MMVGESGQIGGHTKGNGTGYLTNLGATLPVGSTDIIIDTGTGTVLAGHGGTVAGDTNKYLVTTGVAAPGTITIAEPGLKQTLADGVAMTIGASSNEQNMFFDRNAITLITRPPALPRINGVPTDSAAERMMVQDPVTGIPFEISLYTQYKQVKIEVALAWGFKITKPEHVGVLLG
jgi:hypothetical protein